MLGGGSCLRAVRFGNGDGDHRCRNRRHLARRNAERLDRLPARLCARTVAGACGSASAEGDANQAITSHRSGAENGAENGIGNIVVRIDSLVGVSLDGTQPTSRRRPRRPAAPSATAVDQCALRGTPCSQVPGAPRSRTDEQFFRAQYEISRAAPRCSIAVVTDHDDARLSVDPRLRHAFCMLETG